MAPKPLLAVTAFVARDRELLFDDRAIERGIHLRWSLFRDLGFPQNGFDIERRTTQGSWETLHHVRLPETAEEALGRILDGAVDPDRLAKAYREGAEELVTVLQLLTDPSIDLPMHVRELPGESEDTDVILKALDAVLAAAIDPYIARMLGLYWIDRSVDLTNEYLYRVKGLWDGTPWPPNVMEFSRLRPTSQSYEPQKLDALEIQPGARVISVPSYDENDIEGPHLVVIGDGAPALRFHFERPVESIALDYQILDGSHVVAAPSWNITADGTSPAVTADREGMRIDHGHPFEDLDIETGSGDYWKFYRLSSWERNGPIGDIASAPIRVRYSAHPVSIPIVTGNDAETESPRLDENGEVPPPNSNVQLCARVESAPEYPATPVRLHFGRSPHRWRGGPELILTREDDAVVPALYQPYFPLPLLPSLVGCWPLDGNSKDAKSGREARTVGETRYVSEHPWYPAKRSLRLFGDGYLELRNHPGMQTLGSHFTIQMWIRPEESSRTVALFDNGYRHSLGLFLRFPSRRLRCWLNGTSYLSAGAVPLDEWTHVAVNYDGNRLRFFINKELDSEEEIGPLTVAPNASRRTRLGMRLGVRPGPTTPAFRGGIADVQVWQETLQPRQADDLIRRSFAYLPQQESHHELLATWPELYNFHGHSQLIRLERQPYLDEFGAGLTLQAWIQPELTAAVMTIVGNKWDTSFWMGLAQHGPNFKIRFWLNRDPLGHNVFESDAVIAPGEWVHVQVSYDGRQVQFFINGELDSSHAARLGRIRSNPLRELGLGADAGSTAAAKIHPFQGQIASAHIWKAALAWKETAERLGKTQFIDRRVGDGRYRYYAQGIDLFGRLSEWTGPRDVRVKAQPQYNPPLNTHVEFVPIEGSITDVTEHDETIGLELSGRLPQRLALDSPAHQLAGYDLEVSRLADVPGHADRQRVRQNLEIVSARETVDGFFVETKKLPFAELTPMEDDRAVVPFDVQLKLSWAWTGTQRLYHPLVTRFRVYQLNGPLNIKQSRISRVEPSGDHFFRVDLEEALDFDRNELADHPCRVNEHLYYVTENRSGSNPSLMLRYDGFPAAAPRVGDYVQVNVTETLSSFVDYDDLRQWGSAIESVPLRRSPMVELLTTDAMAISVIRPMTPGEPDSLSPDERDSNAVRDRLKEAGVDWIPGSSFYEARINFPLPRHVVNVTPADYLPGALVAFNDRVQQWQTFYVVWHERVTRDEAIFYLLPREKSEPLPEISGRRSRPMRFYPGERYELTIELPELPEFAPGLTSREYAFCITSADDDNHQSGISRIANAVAVDRRRPPVPPAPEATARGADYYQQSQVALEWVATDSESSYLVYRGTDATICSRDLKQRREQTGHYANASAEEVFADDPDVSEWLSARFPHLSDLSALFPERSTTAWQEVTPVWRAWYERFYPALDDAELAQIAEREGNESAFTLVNPQPVRQSQYADRVPGMVRNRYYYRLRSQSGSAQFSSHWSPVSNGVVPPRTMTSKSPKFTKVEAEDRRILVRWRLDEDPDVTAYRLYRSESREELEDLRHWTTDPDPRLLATIPNPLLRSQNHGLEIPSSIPVVEVLGVYRASEFNVNADEPEDQPQTLNFFNSSPTDPSVTPSSFHPSGTGVHRVENLRRIPDGVPMVLVYRDDEGLSHWLSQVRPEPPWIDEDCQPLRDYYYRLTAVSSSGLVSPPSSIVTARSPEIELPEPPAWTSGAWVKVTADGVVHAIDDPVGEPAIQLSWEPPGATARDLQIERRTPMGSWKNIGPSLPITTREFVDREVTPGTAQRYRMLVRSQAGNVNREFHELDVAELEP